MKQLAFLLLLSTLIFACKENPKQVEKVNIEALKKVAFSDSAVIAETIHGFYKWYDAFDKDTTRNTNFTEVKGKHLKINELALKKYLGEFNKSGVVSEEFITNEYSFYKKCEVLWLTEDKDDVPSGMDANKFFCGQDWEFEEFTTAPVTSTITGDRAKATMLFKPKSGNGASRSFELKKENGKWLLAKVECDMGVK